MPINPLEIQQSLEGWATRGPLSARTIASAGGKNNSGDWKNYGSSVKPVGEFWLG